MMYRALTFILFVIAISSNSTAQYLYLDSALTISTQTTYDSVRITSTGILTADDSIAVLGNMTIESGGVVTHSPRLLSGLRLNVIGTLDVQSGGVIDVNGKGLRGGNNGSIFGCNGETFDASDAIVSAGNCSGGGGSYGGWGSASNYPAGSPNSPYGLLENPRHLGSGGGQGWDVGGNGGGRVTITAGSCVVNGTIRANGAGWASTGAGGSGGTIKMIVGTLSGGGVIQAAGENVTNYYGGCGGGGRIAVYYTTNTFPTANILASGGTGNAYPGTAGTILFAKNGDNFVNHSTTDSRIIISPAGNVPFEVTLRDSNNQPVVGSTDVWLDFREVNGITRCPSQFIDEVLAPIPSDSSGKIKFYIKGGGCTSDLVKVKTSKGLIAQVPIKSLDHNGGLLVTAADFVGDACNDYNNDGVTDGKDFDFFSNYLGQSCLDVASNYVRVNISTIPSPEYIYKGDTILVCARIINTINEVLTIDSVAFSSAGFGIARPWTEFSGGNGTTIGPSAVGFVTAPFVIQSFEHGCFQVHVYMRYYSALEERKESQIAVPLQAAAEASANMNIDLKKDPPCKNRGGDSDGDEICDNDDPCPHTPKPCLELGAQQNGGCVCIAKCDIQQPACGHNPQFKLVSSIHDYPVNPLAFHYSQVIIGTGEGDSLQLFPFVFIPSGWYYLLSDSGWIHTPDTIQMGLYSNQIINCGDTGRIVVFAYNTQGEFAGSASVILHAGGTRGDFNNSSRIDSIDLQSLTSNLFQSGKDPVYFESVDLNGDQRIDIADATRLVDYLYVSHEPFACVRDTGYVGPEISIAISYLNDTTTISLISPIDLKGLQLELIGRENVVPENLLGDDSVGIAIGSLHSLYRIGLFDLSGGAVIKSGARNVIRIPGAITILSSRASDKDHHSLPLASGQAIAYEMQSGWNMLSVPIASSNIKYLDLFPSATSAAFTYQDQYVEKDTLKHGIGYWLKFGEHEAHTVLGLPISVDTIDVLSGWNMIGSISEPIPVINITSIPGGLITSDFFEYTSSYVTSDTIYPGFGYWVKVNQDGQLILSSTTKALSKARIRIVPTSEMPPAPPSDIAGRIELPKEYRLEQNYPNPFNPITTIKYGLPFSSNVKLKIFNVLGQVVAILKDEVESAGYKQVEWNSSAVATGIYFYRLEATNINDPSKSFTQVKKMLVMK